MGEKALEKHLFDYVCYVHLGITSTEQHRGHDRVGQSCIWDPPCFQQDRDCPPQPRCGGRTPRESPWWCSTSLPGIAMTWSPTLLCSRSLHSSRTTLQDHHRDHRGGAVGALLILLRWVGDQLHSKGNVTLWHCEQSLLEYTYPSQLGIRSCKDSATQCLSPCSSGHKGTTGGVWALEHLFHKGVVDWLARVTRSLTPWLWKTGCGKQSLGPALCSKALGFGKLWF